VLTVEEAADVLRISRGAAYEAARRGELPSVRLGRSLRVPRSRLLELLGEQILASDESPIEAA
jgi:excisionase family DNA binding protein